MGKGSASIHVYIVVLFHVFALGMCLFSYIWPILEFRAKSDFAWPIERASDWVAIAMIFYYMLCIACDLWPLKTQKRIVVHRDRFFTLCWTVCNLVFFTFWTIVIITVIMKNKAHFFTTKEILASMFQHVAVVIILWLDQTFIFHKYGNKWVEMFISVIFFTSYLGWNIFFYTHTKNWPYQFQASLWNLLKGIPFYFCMILASGLFYFLGKLANYGIWYQRMKDKEKKALLTIKRREAESMIDIKCYGDDMVYQIDNL
eukprot:TRINITY_DN6536_c0_g1_i1.p1 TRINITY_DN6536_c0_g1~~TRINITY_DN6536_c0_g1_i1.p1  ORF type:complete len:258 (-),score=19.39 TRINITY_DN6536_c0_g1_i1:47-820(-)